MELDKDFWFTLEQGLSAYYMEEIPEDVWARFCAAREFFESQPLNTRLDVGRMAQRMFDSLRNESK